MDDRWTKILIGMAVLIGLFLVFLFGGIAASKELGEAPGWFLDMAKALGFVMEGVSRIR